jgi:hypothetical protein
MVAFLAEEDFKSVQKHANLALGSILALSRKIWIKSYHQVSNISYKNGIEQNSCSSTQSLRMEMYSVVESWALLLWWI